MRKTIIAAGIAAAIAGCSIGNYVHYRFHWNDVADNLVALKHRFVQSIATGYLESTVFAPNSAATREYDRVPEVQHLFGSSRAYMKDMNGDSHDDIVLTLGKTELVFLRNPDMPANNYYGFIWDKSFQYGSMLDASFISSADDTGKEQSLDKLVDDHR